MLFPDAQVPAVIERALLPALHYLFGAGAALAAGGALLMLVPGYLAPRSLDPRWGQLAGRCARWVLGLLLGAAFTAGAGAWLGELVLRPRAAERLAAAFGPALGAGGLCLLAGAAALARYASGWRRGRGGSPAHFAAGVLAAAGIWAGAAVLAVFQSFSLNPGRWLETRALRDALLHPSALPAFVLWASGAIALAAAAGLAAAVGQRDAPWRLGLVRTLGRWGAPAAWAGAAGAVWWALSLPSGAQDKSLPAIVGTAFLVQAGLGTYLYRCGAREPRRLSPAGALLALLAAALSPALMQIAREEARGPFFIQGYLYRNGILAEEIPRLQREGFWRPAAWRKEKEAPSPEELGARVFRGECAACHPAWRKGAAQAALPSFREQGAALRFLGAMGKGHPAFPAFAGSEGERRAVAAHLEGLLRTAGVTLAAPAPPAPKAPPKKPEKKEVRPAPVPAAPPKEAVKEAPKEAPKEVPKEAPKEAPKETPKEASKETPPKEAPKGKPPEALPAAAPKPEAETKTPAPPKPPEPRREEPKPEPPRPGPSSQAAPPSPPPGGAPGGSEVKKEAGAPPAAPPAPSAPPAGGGSGSPEVPSP